MEWGSWYESKPDKKSQKKDPEQHSQPEKKENEPTPPF